jgi:hypothetical protein
LKKGDFIPKQGNSPPVRRSNFYGTETIVFINVPPMKSSSWLIGIQLRRQDGALGMQGEHLVLAAFARQKFLLIAEESNTYGGNTWQTTKHDLDFIFERDGVAYGIEVKNTLGYLDIEEFLTKIRLSRHIGVKPVFAVRALPKTWINALIQAGGYAMIMGYQFYPWTHKDVADKIRATLGLPVDTPKRVEQGTMQRFENWIAAGRPAKLDDPKVERLLAKMEMSYIRRRPETPEASDESELENE